MIAVRIRTMSNQPATVDTLYDSLLQTALRQFFERATLSADTATPSADARLAIEPSASPSALIIRWFGTRYTLRVPGRWAFSAHEVRLAQAIGSVLAARHQAILNPRVIGERGDLFRGHIEDRYVGAFLDHRAYAVESRQSRADRIASLIEMLRVAALSSYENQPISTGVVFLGTADDPFRPAGSPRSFAPRYSQSLSGIKSFHRLADGLRTVFLVNNDSRLIDVVDLERWAGQLSPSHRLQVPCAKAYEAHARATLQHGHVCAVLSPSREIKIFAEGAQLFTFRAASWHLLDLQAKYRLWAEAVGNEPLAMLIFQTALDLADAREGALFLIAGDGDDTSQLVAPADRLDLPMRPERTRATAPSRRDLLHVLEGRSAMNLDPSVFAALASLDGATVIDRSGRLLAAGAILRHPGSDDFIDGVPIEGARTTAALAASRFGPVLKVSEDGVITFLERERVWDI
jgi:hypothetical protein